MHQLVSLLSHYTYLYNLAVFATAFITSSFAELNFLIQSIERHINDARKI